MKKRLTVIVVMLSLLLSGTVVALAQDKVTIGIIQLMEHNALDAARTGFIAALNDNGYVVGENVELDYQNAQGDAANLSTISDRFVGKKVDLVLAIATPAAQAIAGKTAHIPILGTAITDYEAARLVDSNERPGGNVTGTSDLNPIKEQIELLIKLAPQAETIGLLYTSSEDNSVVQAKIAKQIIKEMGLKYKEVTISNSNEVQQATQAVVKQADAIYIPTDNIFASAMPVVHGVAVASKTPVVPGETGMAMAGGLASLGVNYFDLGYQTGLMAIEILTGQGVPASMPIQLPQDYDYVVNGKVAEEMGLEIPDDLLRYVIEQ